MADFNYDEYMTKLKEPFDPYKVSSGQKWGLALSALGSALSRSQAPTQNFMSSMDMIQQQQAAQHQATLAQYQAQMDAIEHQKRMQSMDINIATAKTQQEMIQKEKEFAQKSAEAVNKQLHEDTMNKIKQEQAIVDNKIKTFKQVMSTLGTATGVSKNIPQSVKDMGSKMTTMAGEQKKKGIEEKIMPELTANEAAITAAGETGDIGNVQTAREMAGVMNPLEKKKYEQEQQLFGIDLQTAQKQLENLQRGEQLSPAQILDAASAIYAADGDASNLIPADTPNRDLIIESAKSKGKLMKQLRQDEINSQRDRNPKPPTEGMDVWSMKSYVAMTGKEQEFAIGSLRDIARSGDENTMRAILQDQIAKGASKDIIRNILSATFRNNPKDPLEAFYPNSQINPALLQTGLLVGIDPDGTEYPITDVKEVDLATPESRDAALQSVNQSYGVTLKKGLTGYSEENQLMKKYYANPAGFLDAILSGGAGSVNAQAGGEMGDRLLAEFEAGMVKEKAKNTPLGKTIEAKTVQAKERASNLKGRNLSQLAERESSGAINKLLKLWWSLDPTEAELKIQKQLSTPEGIEQIKSYFTDANGNPYDDMTMTLIITTMKDKVDKLISGRKKSSKKKSTQRPLGAP